MAISQANIDRDDENLPFDNQTKSLGISPVPKRHLELELRWLHDKVKLAEHIKELLLKKDEPEKALAIVQLASKSRDEDHVVAWNHLLRYTLDKGQTERAFKLYNEMKKRGQSPDSHTYLTMLKGFGITKNTIRKPSRSDISRVISIYNSMSAPNSKVKPAILHANAALQACSLVNDMDSIWKIMSGLDEEGANAPDSITYTVLLNALRLSSLADIDSQTNLETVQNLKLEAAKQGREIWVGVVEKWRKNILSMDDQLVVAMAQLLLHSPAIEDWDDVLNLVEQTMGISRTLAPLRERKLEHLPPQDRVSRPPDTPLGSVFLPLTIENKSVKPRGARPRPSTLSTLMKACLKLRAPSAAEEYWIQMTADKHFRPDLFNLEHLLQICSVNRRSGVAARVLEQAVGKHKLQPRFETFQEAMNACSRDNKNYKVVSHAAIIVHVMMTACKQPHIEVLTTYLSLATLSNVGVIMSRALEHLLDGPVLKLKALIEHDASKSTEDPARTQMLHDFNSFLKEMVGAVDTLVKRNLVPEKSHATWLERRADLDRLIAAVRAQIKASGGDTSEDHAFNGERGRSRLRSQNQRIQSQGRDHTSTRSAANEQDNRGRFQAQSRHSRRARSDNDPSTSSQENKGKYGRRQSAPFDVADVAKKGDKSKASARFLSHGISPGDIM